MIKLLLSYPAEGEQVPAILLEPKPAGKAVVVWIDKQGKQGLFENPDSDRPNARVRDLLLAGIAVLGVDLFGQGEFTPDGKPLAKARLNKEHGWDRYLAYTLGYNHPLFSQRVHDILSAVAYLSVVRTGETPVLLRRTRRSPWWDWVVRGIGWRPRGRKPALRWTWRWWTRPASASPRSPPWMTRTCSLGGEVPGPAGDPCPLRAAPVDRAGGEGTIPAGRSAPRIKRRATRML